MATAKQATYVINLAHRTDRRRAMSRELARVGWQAEFFPAVKPDTPAGFPSIGARGCFLSHLGVLKIAMQSGADRLVILEDDLNFSDDFNRQWLAVLDAIADKQWSIVYPGHNITDLHPGLFQLSPSTGVRCTHFMMFNASAIPTLVDELEKILARPPGDPLGGPMHVDGAYSTIRAQHPELRTYAFAPSLGSQRSSRSDIAEPKWFDRIPGTAVVVDAARTLKGKLTRL